jgi:AcrR family transcriptional regulator
MEENTPRPASSALSSKGQARRQLIVERALEVFIDAGYADFSLRHVARRAHISVGNLHYYFPNKGALLTEMFASVREDYAGQFASLLEDAGDSPRERFVAIVSYLVRDLCTRRTSVFFPELWAMANHDAAASALMEEMYAWERAHLAGLIGALAPSVGRDRRAALALFVSASIEGLTVFIGHGKPYADRVEAVLADALEAFLLLIARAEQDAASVQ